MRAFARLVIGGIWASLAACGGDGPPSAGRLPLSDACEHEVDGWRCDDDVALLCEDGHSLEKNTCDAEQVCVPNSGCRACLPHTVTCEDERFLRCRPDGSGYEVEQTCGADTQCSVLGCRDLCQEAAEQRSYIGCEYWPVTTANASLAEGFEPALVVGNANFQTAHLRLSRDGKETAYEVDPGGVRVVPLPFVEALKRPYEDPEAFQQPRSVLARAGGYRLASDVPVTVHQFNPLEFRDAACIQSMTGGDTSCFSHTNDASLLLPTSALTGDYMVISRPTFAVVTTPGSFDQQRPGFVAIVGTQAEPTEVEVRVTAHVAASGAEEEPDVQQLAPGDTLRVQLSAGDVLQLASAAVSGDCPGATAAHRNREGERVFDSCDTGVAYDLTGTEIEASAPVSVIAGHDCTFVPFDVPACDHLEETLFPIQTWADEVVVTAPRRADGDSYQVKVVSAIDGNRIRVDPPLAQALTLDRGESYEWSSAEHLVISADGPVSVAQFLVGQGGGKVSGDPSMSFAVPRAQFKRDYTLLTPATFTRSYVNIVAAPGTEVRLDDEVVEVESFEPVGESGLAVARLLLDPPGLHTVTASAPVGVSQYGYARYTSYMVPGGLDFQLLYESPF